MYLYSLHIKGDSKKNSLRKPIIYVFLIIDSIELGTVATCPRATLSTTNPTLSDMESNPTAVVESYCTAKIIATMTFGLVFEKY
jgi:hypothetical protein